MYTEDNEHIIEYALKKKKFLDNHPLRYLISSGLAGAYVGVAVILMFSVSAPLYAVHSPFTYLIMGLSFGVALTLVVFAGAELFTGNNMAFTISTYSGATSVWDTIKNWVWCWLGNFMGAFVFAALVFGAGLFKGIAPEHQLMVLAVKKMTLPGYELFFRGILCNWLVCLAIWTSHKAKSESAKLILIFWCLFAFISSGFEHSIANMTTLSLALLLDHPANVTLSGMFHNLGYVTLGNIVGGALFVGTAYWLISPIRNYREKLSASTGKGTHSHKG
ncbi:formate/nitrite transporter family protein [Gorillibacterium sp. CAU 1737]|uniref:formate/nitrite transporter family protein n=1 Tax=Gorillibacterium sp. CAU 1737 TaxID=3140362 RepID=UPI00325FF123